MQKNYIIFIIAAALLVILAFSIGRSTKSNSPGVAADRSRETELLEQLRGYEQREATRVAAERERIARTEEAIRALRESDRRASSLYEELIKEIDLLENYLRDTADSLNKYGNSVGDNE